MYVFSAGSLSDEQNSALSAFGKTIRMDFSMDDIPHRECLEAFSQWLPNPEPG
jgi:hypothetical protein